MCGQVEYDPRYVVGCEHFNRREFFEAHEAWEELWTDDQGPSRRFYQGLIQAAVCLYHFGNGNTRGGRKLYHTCRAHLEGYLPAHGGVNVAKLLAELEGCCAELVACPDYFPRVQINPDLIPNIHLETPTRLAHE